MERRFSKTNNKKKKLEGEYNRNVGIFDTTIQLRVMDTGKKIEPKLAF